MRIIDVVANTRLDTFSVCCRNGGDYERVSISRIGPREDYF